MRGFHLMVWPSGRTRVFADAPDAHGALHVPEFDKQFSLWLLVRLWLWARVKRSKH